VFILPFKIAVAGVVYCSGKRAVKARYGKDWNDAQSRGRLRPSESAGWASSPKTRVVSIEPEGMGAEKSGD
jgi:hypothetical protein